LHDEETLVIDTGICGRAILFFRVRLIADQVRQSLSTGKAAVVKIAARELTVLHRVTLALHLLPNALRQLQRHAFSSDPAAADMCGVKARMVLLVTDLHPAIAPECGGGGA